ncbi:hypothetical protein C8J56DRAFT_1159803 [Mycena floridula]|nr:hypothetical protein C8J56DRAFT_1159803 [Mycena floridula]
MKLERKSPSVQPQPENGVDLRSATEIPYPVASEWPDDKIFDFLSQNALSIPPATPPGPHFFPVTSRSLGSIQLPCKYRIPLLWMSKYQWQSLQLALTATDRDTEWEKHKLRILHVARLCNELLERAKSTMTGRRIDKRWRCAMFDRILVRYWDHCLGHDADSIAEHTALYGSVYKGDILKLVWKDWARKGHDGFRLTDTEIDNGITADGFTRGLQKKAGVWTWTTTPDGLPAPILPPTDVSRVKTKRVQVKPEPLTTTRIPKPPPPVKVKVKAPVKPLPVPRAPRPAAAPLPFPLVNQVESMERQISALVEELKSLQDEQTRSKAAQEALRDEYIQSQQEIRTLKRKFSSADLGTPNGLGPSKYARLIDEEDILSAPPPASATSSTLGHALSHLLMDDFLTSESDEGDENGAVMSVSARPWKTQRQLERFNG